MRAESPPRRYNGALTPAVLDVPHAHGSSVVPSPDLDRSIRLRASVQNFPGGLLNFERFETDNIEACVEFVRALIERSAEVNGVSVEEMRSGVRLVATGGGAHRFYDLFASELGVPVEKEDEMECLIEGLKFISLIPHEVYYFSDELLQHFPSTEGTLSASAAAAAAASKTVANGNAGAPSQTAPVPSTSSDTPQPPPLDRPSANPPKYSVSFEANPTPQLPCLLVNIGSGVSIIKVDEDGSFERVSGTSLGGATLWGLLSLLTPATTFDEMLDLSERGDNAKVDMLVGDIYGQDYGKLGLKSTTIASSFGKVFKKGGASKKDAKFSAEDISKSLLYAVSNNIGQIAYMNAEKYNLDRIYFGGCFIRGHAATIGTLSYAIRFWSKGTKRALFLRHEGFLGSIGAWIKHVAPRNPLVDEDDANRSGPA